MLIYDAFISYATEDQNLVAEIAGGLKTKGFRIWYDQFVLRVGDNLLKTIEDGLINSKHGILFISHSYLKKGWTNYEMDNLIRHSIEKNKKLLPIWHDVSKEEIEKRHLGLGGIFALHSVYGTQVLVTKLTDVLSEGLQTRGIAPSYESPQFRFLQGRGELKLGHIDGPAFNIFEAVLQFKEDEYPLVIEGETFSKEMLIWYVAEALAGNEYYIKSIIGEKKFEKVWKFCKEFGINPEKLK